MEKLLEGVLERIVPSEEEEHAIFTQATRLQRIGEKVMPKSVKAVLVGSLAKGTWLRNKADIDLFFLFQPFFPLEEAMPLLHKVADELEGERELLYAQHPYLHVHFRDTLGGEKIYEADLVPAYDVPPDKIRSAVDRSPYHTEFVRENLASPDDARLLKQFCSGIGVYGADMVHQGFSGYLCELLVIRFGSFRDAVEEAAAWEVPQKVEGLVEHSSKMEFGEPLVLRDPVDPDRNVAAAVSEKTLKKFIKACKAFVKKPTEKFFFKESLPDIPLESMEGLLVVKVKADEATEDIIASQTRSLMLWTVGQLNCQGFQVERYELFEEAFAVIVKNEKLPEEEIHEGPPLKLEEHCEKFMEKWPDAYEENGKLKVVRKREFTDARSFLEAVLPKHLPNHVQDVEVVKKPRGKLKKRVAVFVEGIPSWRF